MRNDKKNIHFIILIFIFTWNMFSQELNEDYLLFSDTNDYSEYICFKNDSTLIRKPYYSKNYCFLMSKNKFDYKQDIYKEYKYLKINDCITIFEFENTKDVKYRITNDKYFENIEKREVYVLLNQFEDLPNIAVRYNDKTYWLNSPETSNGIITKQGKKNKKLSRILKKADQKKMEVKLFKKYEAFEKFGFNYVFGIIEIKNNGR